MTAQIDHKKSGTGRAKNKFFIAVVCVFLSSCVLAEGSGYVVQDAPPNGIHLTISNFMTDQLRVASDFVMIGVNIDHVLRDRDINTTCPDLGGRTNGDRCAFRILDWVKLEGWLAFLGNPAWNDATASDEFDDFRNDGMTAVRVNQWRCLHVTIRYTKLFPWNDDYDSNWTYRSGSDPKC